MNLPPLSPRQAEALAFLREYQEKQGMPPTRREMMEHLKTTAPEFVQQIVAALEKKGRIVRAKGHDRGITVLGLAPLYPDPQIGGSMNIYAALQKKTYRCPKGHTFQTTGFNSVPGVRFTSPWPETAAFCPKCFVLWLEANIPALEEVKEPT